MEEFASFHIVLVSRLSSCAYAISIGRTRHRISMTGSGPAEKMGSTVRIRSAYVVFRVHTLNR